MAEAIYWEVVTFFLSGVINNWVFILCGIIALFKASAQKPFGGLLVFGFLWNLIAYFGFIAGLRRNPEAWSNGVGQEIGNILFFMVLVCVIAYGCYRLDKKAAERADAEAAKAAKAGQPGEKA